MKAALAVCLFGLVGFTIAQECADQVTTYLNCLKGQGEAKRAEFEAKRAEFEAKRKEFEAKEPEFKACLTAGGCTPPPAPEGQPGEILGKGKGGKSKGGKSKGGLENLNATAKACLQTQFQTKITAKLTQCLGHAPPTWVNQVLGKLIANGPPHKGRWGKHGGPHGPHGGPFGGPKGGCSQDVIKGCFKTVFNIDKDNTHHAAPTPEERKAQKEAHCAAAATCEASITGQCKTDFDEIKAKACSCNHDSAAGVPHVDPFTACGIPKPFGGKHGGPRMQGPAASAVANAATGKGKRGKRSFKPPFCKCQPGQDNDEDEDNDDDEDEDDDE